MRMNNKGRPAGSGERCSGGTFESRGCCRDENGGSCRRQCASNCERHNADHVWEQVKKAGMYVGMVVIAGCGGVVLFCCTSLMVIMVMIVSVFMAVMSEMCRDTRRVFQRIANTHRSRMSGIQRKHDRKKQGEYGAHGPKYNRQKSPFALGGIIACCEMFEAHSYLRPVP